jgi:hypothetical protein
MGRPQVTVLWWLRGQGNTYLEIRPPTYQSSKGLRGQRNTYSSSMALISATNQNTRMSSYATLPFLKFFKA